LARRCGICDPAARVSAWPARSRAVARSPVFGTGHAAQIAELEATRTRLREDRQAGSMMTARTRTGDRIPAAGGGNHGAEGAARAQAGHAPGADGPHHSPSKRAFTLDELEAFFDHADGQVEAIRRLWRGIGGNSPGNPQGLDPGFGPGPVALHRICSGQL